MADYEATGEGLEKLVRMGRKRPMPFAYCPPKGDEDGLFATHRKKAPELIAKAARKAAATTKVCYGTFTVENKVMNVVLIKELPNIAKKLKKHLRRERLSLNVRILDAFGNELESDFDEVGDLAEIFGDGDATDDFDEDDDEDEDDDDDEDSSTGGEDLAVAAQTEVQEEIDDLTDEDGHGKAAADPTELAKRLRALHPSAAELPKDIGARLLQALSGAANLIRAGALRRAEETIEAIEGAFERQTRLAQAAKDAPKADPGIGIALAKQLVALRSQAEDLADPARSKLLAALGLAAQQVKSGETQRAAQNIRMIETALSQSTDRTLSIEAVFAASRTDWSNTQTVMHTEIQKLKHAMDKTLSSIDGMAAAVSETDKLFSYLDALDDRLDGALQALIAATEGTARDRLKAQARQIIEDYRTELDSPFFRDVDGDNGFAPINLRGPALKSLSDINAALA